MFRGRLFEGIARRPRDGSEERFEAAAERVEVPIGECLDVVVECPDAGGHEVVHELLARRSDTDEHRAAVRGVGVALGETGSLETVNGSGRRVRRQPEVPRDEPDARAAVRSHDHQCLDLCHREVEFEPPFRPGDR